jgi:hypothetical protein
MRPLRTLPLAVPLAVLVGSAAHAGPLASATLTVEAAGISTTFPGVGATGTATSATSAALGAGAAFVGTDTGFGGTLPSIAKAQGVVGLNGAGLFLGASPSDVGGSAPFDFTEYLYATPSAATPFLRIGGFRPLGIDTAYTVMGSGLSWSVWGAPWSAGVVTLGDIFGGTVTPVLKVTGMNSLTPSGAGTLTLVAPLKASFTTGNIVPVVATLTLNYIPEPGTALLLGLGALAIARLGRGGRR